MLQDVESTEIITSAPRERIASAKTKTEWNWQEEKVGNEDVERMKDAVDVAQSILDQDSTGGVPEGLDAGVSQTQRRRQSGSRPSNPAALHMCKG